ncbi:mechanosensitive ion channel protein MscL [Candidatus Kaiserbacteria bacterium RIFCSPHIGHO2_02_FULL_54_11b]|uniref:Large-conductance mechanosensitive channel n=1 Tax=Candidatus Kaiserbacteria bacterium RIFCSPHIGHO2_02_FULL_54_11b TaxID=1798494 RepID=A0A1F6DS33_9BACT|nr:MAG: mechanosensitive ion channel protein MscL [Candidatus Kaiserbacteria bacterium RIFCSPHIGHO2_02_FULL_54_11b]
MLKEFKQFLLRGNVVDLAVGVVIGAAFGSIVNALVFDIVTPLVSGVARVPDLGGLMYTVNGSEIKYGHFLNTIISFLIIATAIFFFVVKPMNLLVERARKDPPSDPTTKKCSECLCEIPAAAKRCSHCTQPVV